jgi:hypothetical protein
MAPWQRITLKAAGFGAGFAAILVAAIAGWLVFQSLPETPKPWNRDAIKATYADLYMDTGDRPVATFKYMLENTTPHDYYLPSDPRTAFVVLPDGKGMSQEEELTWDKGVYVPPGQKVSVSFKITYDYNESYPKSDRDNLDKLSKFMTRRLKELAGFAVLDRTNRYQVTFPKGWQDSPSESNETSLSNPTVEGARVRAASAPQP